MSKNNVVNISFPIFGLVGLCLIIAKLGGIDPVASWSWWLVTLPFWFGIVAVVAIIVIYLLIAAVFFIGAMLFAFFMTLLGK